MKRISLIVIFCLFVVIPVFAATIDRVNIREDGGEANDNLSSKADISGDGRYVTFSTSASNLIDNDTNGFMDVFVYDRTNESIDRISINNDGEEGNSASFSPVISADGRYVAFASNATNLVSGDTNSSGDIFVFDRNLRTIERVSVDDNGVEGDDDLFGTFDISADGRYVAFGSVSTNLVPSDTNGVADVFVRDRVSHTTQIVSVSDGGIDQGDGASLETAISGDGRYIVFSSQATTLVGADNNVLQDIFVHDRNSSTTQRVSIDNLGNEADNVSFQPTISDNGRYVAFGSEASNLVSGDSGFFSDIFVYDLEENTIERVSINNNGEEGDGTSSEPSISADGRYVTFSSEATNLVANDTNGASDIFIYDRVLDSIERITENEGGDEANGGSSLSVVAPTSSGRFVAFASSADNLVDDDNNTKSDAFVYDREGSTIERVRESSTSSGYVSPHINIRGGANQTSSRMVNLEAWAPISVTRYEISNLPNFSVKEGFPREHLMRDVDWDICRGINCNPGQKKIYARFYMSSKLIKEQALDIEYVPGKECPYFKQYLRKGSKKNLTEEVRKVQEFLNKEIGSGLTVDGVFGETTDRAVRVFQEKYPEQIISPWLGLDHSTGRWYITTRAYANILVGC